VFIKDPTGPPPIRGPLLSNPELANMNALREDNSYMMIHVDTIRPVGYKSKLPTSMLRGSAGPVSNVPRLE